MNANSLPYGHAQKLVFLSKTQAVCTNCHEVASKPTAYECCIMLAVYPLDLKKVIKQTGYA